MPSRGRGPCRAIAICLVRRDEWIWPVTAVRRMRRSRSPDPAIVPLWPSPQRPGRACRVVLRLRGQRAARAAHDERLAVAGGICVEPAGAAVARPRARHRQDLGLPAFVQGRGTGNLLRWPPDAPCLPDDERLEVAGGIYVVPAGAAVARPRARHQGDLGEPALVQRRSTRDLPRWPPDALHLPGDERLLVAGDVCVEPAGTAVARPRARH